MNDIDLEYLIELSKNLSHKGKNAGIMLKGSNPVCGDELSIYLEIENDTIKKANFDGYCCALTSVSANIFCDYLEGRSFTESKKIILPKFHEIINIKTSAFRTPCKNLPFQTFITNRE